MLQVRALTCSEMWEDKHCFVVVVVKYWKTFCFCLELMVSSFLWSSFTVHPVRKEYKILKWFLFCFHPTDWLELLSLAYSCRTAYELHPWSRIVCLRKLSASMFSVCHRETVREETGFLYSSSRAGVVSLINLICSTCLLFFDIYETLVRPTSLSIVITWLLPFGVWHGVWLCSLGWHSQSCLLSPGPTILGHHGGLILIF